MKFKVGQEGQTSVEYILLVGVMVAISITFFTKVRDYMLDNPDSVIEQYLGGFRSTFGTTNGPDQRYKTFNLKR